MTESKWHIGRSSPIYTAWSASTRDCGQRIRLWISLDDVLTQLLSTINCSQSLDNVLTKLLPRLLILTPCGIPIDRWSSNSCGRTRGEPFMTPLCFCGTAVKNQWLKGLMGTKISVKVFIAAYTAMLKSLWPSCGQATYKLVQCMQSYPLHEELHIRWREIYKDITGTVTRRTQLEDKRFQRCRYLVSIRYGARLCSSSSSRVTLHSGAVDQFQSAMLLNLPRRNWWSWEKTFMQQQQGHPGDMR